MKHAMKQKGKNFFLPDSHSEINICLKTSSCQGSICDIFLQKSMISIEKCYVGAEIVYKNNN